jgi:hypothetical protein
MNMPPGLRRATDPSDSALTDSHTPPAGPADESPHDDQPTLQEPRLWRGEPEPALVGPWTMGRDKKNPKPLDGPAFSTLVKTASEFVRRHEQQLHATLHQSITVTANAARITISLDIVPDEDNPHGLLSATDEAGEQLAQVRVAPSFKLNRASAVAWAENGFAKPAGR